MRAARREAEQFRKNMVSQFKRISVGTVALGAALTALTGKVSQEFDNIAKSARNLNIETEVFSQLSFAFGQLGVEQSQFSRGFSTLSKAIGEAGLGTKTYIDALDILGLSYRQLRTLRPEQQYLAVIGALGDVTDLNARTLAGNRLLGGSYRQLGTAIATPVEEIRTLAASVDGVNDMAARSFEGLNDQVDRLGTNFTTAFGNALGGSGAVDSLTGALDRLQPTFMEVTSALGDMTAGIIDAVLHIAGLAEEADRFNQRARQRFRTGRGREQAIEDQPIFFEAGVIGSGRNRRQGQVPVFIGDIVPEGLASNVQEVPSPI